MIGFRNEELQVFSLPEHRCTDAIAAARMVEEDPFFQRSRAHFAVFTEMNRGLREAIRLAAGVQAIHVRFEFIRASVGVEESSRHKAEKGAHQENQREHRRVADSANLPLCSPPAEGPIQRPSQKDEEDDDENREKEQVLGNVMENVVPHLMAHHRLNLFGRSAPQKVYQMDASRQTTRM